MPRYVTSTLTALALAGSVNVFAQQPPPAQPETQQAAKETLTGCVVEAKTTDGGKVYVLNNVEGRSGMYLLTGPTESEWATNVNKKLEVTGPVQQPNPPEAGAAANPNAVRPAVVEVESVKVVADNCR
jgi:hypothetical protein